MYIDIKKLSCLLETPEALLAYLDGLSNAQFRQAGLVLGENMLPKTTEHVFWSIFSAMFRHNRKAYLGTLLKALAKKINATDASSEELERLGLWEEEFCTICQKLTETDRKKILLSLLPLLKNPADTERLLVQCGLKESSLWIPFLLQINSKPCAFLLLKALRYVEHDKALLIRTCHFLMKRGDDLSFSVASIMRLSFGLEEVHGTFSLSLKPYQLARVEQSYEAFSMLF